MENLTMKMTTVKLDAGYNGDNFFITFRQGVEKGEKFDREKSVVFHTAEFTVKELPESLFIDCPAARHGLKQKMSDNLAMTKDAKEATSIADAVKMTEELWKQLVDGNWNSSTRGPKAASIKLTDMEAKFMTGVIAGITSWDDANNLYKSITGKDLPALPETTEE